MTVKLCSCCVEKLLRQKLGSTVLVQSGSQAYRGKLRGVHVNGRLLTVLLQEGSEFRVVENITSINFASPIQEPRK